MSRALVLILPLLIIGCVQDKVEDDSCESLCSVLVKECAFAAYTSTESCTQGCAYKAEQGADVAELLSCVQEADDCDPFALAECEHAHGN